MKNQHTSHTPAETAGLAVSDSLLHVSHIIDEFCDGFLARIYKDSRDVLQQDFVREHPFDCEGAVRSDDWEVDMSVSSDWFEYTREEWATLESLMSEASSDWKEGF